MLRETVWANNLAHDLLKRKEIKGSEDEIIIQRGQCIYSEGKASIDAEINSFCSTQ